MTKLKRGICLIITTLILALSACLMGGCGGAQEVDFGEIDYRFKPQKNSPVNGVYSLNLSLSGGDGVVEVVARNQVEIFVGTIQAVLDLYTSDEYCETHEGMERVARQTADDLNFRETLTIRCPTGGVSKYYFAALHFRVDNKPTKTYTINTMRLDANGDFAGLGRGW